MKNNYIAKNMNKFNKSNIHKDRKKESKINPEIEDIFSEIPDDILKNFHTKIDENSKNKENSGKTNLNLWLALLLLKKEKND